MRFGVAIALAGVAVAGAVYFNSLRLDSYRYYVCGGPALVGNDIACTDSLGFPERNAPRKYAEAHRHGTWQLPVAIVIAAVGIGSAVAVARSGERG